MRRISHLTDLRTLLDPWLMENHKPSQSFLELHGELKVQIFSLFKGQGLTEDSLKECQANRSSKQFLFKQFLKEEMIVLTRIWFNGSINSSSVVFPSISLLGHICHQTQCYGLVWFYFLGIGLLCYLYMGRLISTLGRLCSVLHMILKVCKAAGPRCPLTTPVLVLVTHTMLQAVKSLAWSYQTVSLPLEKIQSLALHTSALALCQGKFIVY